MNFHTSCALVGTLLLIAVSGCGDSVSDSKKLSDLTAEEAKDVCLELASDYPERTVTCGQATITIGITKAECDAGGEPTPATCAATVGDIRDCNDALYSLTDAQLCADTPLPAACAKLEGC